MHPKIAILGAGGMAGSLIYKYLFEHYDAVPFYREDFDVLNDPMMKFSNYDFVINCIGLIKQKSEDHEKMMKINAQFPHQLSSVHNKVIHISSDCVFSGKISKNEKYKTNDFKDAEDIYGQSKAKGEPTNALVLRTSIIGPAKDNYGLFEWFRNTNEPVKGFLNHWWSGITTLELAKTIRNKIKNYSYGVQQIASSKINKYDLLSSINDAFQLNKIIHPHTAELEINRVLEPDIKSPPIYKQLKELKEYCNG